MKIIFLDIDGVMNTSSSRYSYGIEHIEDGKLFLLKEIVFRTGAKIVLSSSWRIGRTKRLVEIALNRVGLTIYDCTPSHKLNYDEKYNRANEINDWLVNINKQAITKIAVIDDDESADLGHSFFLTDDDFGLTEGIVDSVVEYLG